MPRKKEYFFEEFSDYAEAVRDETIPPFLFALQNESEIENFSQELCHSIEVNVYNLGWRVWFRWKNLKLMLKFEVKSLFARPFEFKLEFLSGENIQTGDYESVFLSGHGSLFDDPRKELDVNRPAPKLSEPLKMPRNIERVYFSTTFHRFLCSCVSLVIDASEATWCEHIAAFLEERRDDGTITSVLLADEPTGHIDYPLARGAASARVDVVRHTKRELFGEDDDSYVIHLDFMQQFPVYVDEGDPISGRMVIDQIRGVVEASTERIDWANGSAKCRHRFHSRTDDKKLETLKAQMFLEQFVFANAFYTIFDNRCLSCHMVAQSMADDSPEY